MRMMNKEGDNHRKLKDRIKEMKVYNFTEFEAKRIKLSSQETDLAKLQELVARLTKKCDTNARYLLPQSTEFYEHSVKT